MIVAGCRAKEIKEALARYYPRTAEVSQPRKVQEVKDAVRQFSYCVKPFWTKRVIWIDAEGKAAGSSDDELEGGAAEGNSAVRGEAETE